MRTIPNNENGISVAKVNSPNMIRIESTSAIIARNFKTGFRSFKNHSHSMMHIRGLIQTYKDNSID